MSQALNFPNVTAAQYAALQDAAKAKGIAIAPDGSFSYRGCTGSFAYVPAIQYLTIVMASAPFGLMGEALKLLHDAVEGVLNAPGTAQ